MTVNYRPVSFPIMGGVDTKTHGFVLPAPKLQTVINAYSDQTGSLKRRFGRAVLANLDSSGVATSGWVATGKSNDRLLGFTSDKLYDYATNPARWVDKGRCTSWRMQSKDVPTGTNRTPVGGVKDMAIIGEYKCYAFDSYGTSGANTISNVCVTLTDSNDSIISNAKVLATSTGGSALSSAVRVVAHGLLFYVVFWDVSTAKTLKCFLIDTTSAAAIASSLAASSVSVATDLELATSTACIMDACDNSTYGPFVAYRSDNATPTINYGHLSTAGAMTNAGTSTSAGVDAQTLSVDVAPGNAMHGIVFTHSVTPSDVRVRLVSWSGAAWTATASSAALDTALSAVVLSQACKFDSATVLRVFYSGDHNVTLPCVRQATYNTAGTIGTRVQMLPRSYLASKPFTGTDSQIYYWVINEPINGIVQPTLFLMRYDGVLSGFANQGLAPFPLFQSFGLPHVPSSGSSYSLFTDYFATIQANFTGSLAVGATGGSREVMVTMTHDDSHVSIEDDGVTYIPSGYVQQYDGVGCTEVGFLSFVDATAVTTNVSYGGGTVPITPVVTFYQIINEWINARGQREQGTNNGSFSVTVTGTLATVTIKTNTEPWTAKKSPRANYQKVLYATLPDAGADAPFYRVTTLDNDPTADTVTFTSPFASGDISLNETLYTDSGELDNVNPPPGHILAAGAGRVFVAGLPDDPCLIMYSKQRGHGQPLTFNDALQIPIPRSTGPITALAVMNEGLIVFTRTAIYRVRGEGANNVGAGGFGPAELVTTDSGARGPRGVAVTPDGLLYQGIQGIMLFSQSLQGQYIGAPLEKLPSPGDCTGIATVPALQQVRVSFADTTHVWDYYHKQWYVFSHGSLGPTCTWNDVHTAVAGSNDDIEYDSTSAWTDGGDPYAMTVVLGWEKFPATLQGDLRVRRVGLTGESLGAHNLSIGIAHNYGAVSQTITSTIAAPALLKDQWRLTQQVSNAVEITIRDALLDVYGADVVVDSAGMLLLEVTFEIGVRGSGFARE